MIMIMMMLHVAHAFPFSPRKVLLVKKPIIPTEILETLHTVYQKPC